MPLYHLTVPQESPTAKRKAAVARAVTEVHVSVTGAPAEYVNVVFTEVPPGSIFVAGEPVEAGRLVGTIRSGRSPETKKRLLMEIAAAWSAATGEPVESFALFLDEVPGEHMLEEGRFLPEAPRS